MDSGTLRDEAAVDVAPRTATSPIDHETAAARGPGNPSWQRGYVHVYTGNGKGKTTAALGLILRALGAGLRVCFVQFLKGKPSSEIRVLERFPELITIRRFARFVGMDPRKADLDAAKRGVEEIRRMVRAGGYALVVLDEANVATQFGLLEVDDLLDLIDTRPPGSEIVITGRYAHPRILDRADLVTDMNEVKHYYHVGALAREGIER